MKEHYTLKQAMERLGIRSLNAFRQLVRKYPDVFMNINQNQYKGTNPWYDKAALDKFATTLERLKQEKP